MPDLGLWTWLFVFVAALLLNVVPAFMPPTWSLLAYIHLESGLPIVGLAIVGGLGAMSGRFLLAMGSRVFGTRFVPRTSLENISHLATTLESRKGLSLSMFALFSIGPIPSNHLFIAAGIARIRLLFPLIAFGVVRTLSYVIWVTLTDTAARSLRDVLSPSLGGWIGAVAQIGGFALLIVIFRTDWARIVQRWLPPQREGNGDEAP
jgi:hypothetical protein